MILDAINSPSDLKNLNVEQLNSLSHEIREILIKKASVCGGHLASNLGVVEITIALHYVFNTPIDKIIFDVSHQCYTHKILTGRKKAFTCENEYGSVTGFTNPKESQFDLFNIGHTSTSISLASGLAKARDYSGDNYNVIALIGDSALDGGEAFEALNNVCEIDGGLIIVINDNHMSIPENHGFINNHLNDLYDNDGVVNNNLFNAFGLNYYFVKDGHDIHELIKVFERVKNTNDHVVIHCRTTKGKGYLPAEENQEQWHHAHPFDIDSGCFLKVNTVPKENYGSIVGEYLSDKIKKDMRIIPMTASVPACFGFNSIRRMEAGKQFIDVGICEQHLISMACGLSIKGYKPVVITESSFYQRAYDQIEQELAINKCPVTMLIAFSGIYGHDDNTHIGLYDISLFSNLNNVVYLAPSCKEMYMSILEWSIEKSRCPVFIRIPWNGVHYLKKGHAIPDDYSKTKYLIREKGTIVAIIALGSFYQLGENVLEILKTHSIMPTLIDPVFASGIDNECLEELKNDHKLVVTIEDGVVTGGFGSKISQFFGNTDIHVINFGFSDELDAKFDRESIIKKNNLQPSQIAKTILDSLDY